MTCVARSRTGVDMEKVHAVSIAPIPEDPHPTDKSGYPKKDSKEHMLKLLLHNDGGISLYTDEAYEKLKNTPVAEEFPKVHVAQFKNLEEKMKALMQLLTG